VIERRASDHAHVDAILASRVPEEDRLLQASEQLGDRTLIDRLMTPFNRRATTRFLKESRRQGVEERAGVVARPPGRSGAPAREGRRARHALGRPGR
jgi:hypothetical protein